MVSGYFVASFNYVVLAGNKTPGGRKVTT